MPSTPTTKSQVQAYRFVLRRMQSALVRKDAVMLHDPMRTHSRATIVGICLAAVGMLGFLIWGILSPKPTAPTEDGIVIGKPSGQVYVMIAKPETDKKLIPVFNLASARLVLMARAQQNTGGEGGGQQQAPQAAAKVEEPEVVDDNELRDIPRGRKMGIPNGPDLLPGKDQRIDANWAVCDTYQLDKDQPQDDVGSVQLDDPNTQDNEDTPEARQEQISEKIKTTVIAGQKNLGEPLTRDGSILVRAKDGLYYLIYRTPASLNTPNTQTVRAKVDIRDLAVRSALNIDETKARWITLGLLNSIPPASDIVVPPIVGDNGAEPGEDSRVQGENGNPLAVGDVYKVTYASDDTRYFAVEHEGLERIKNTTADLLQAFDSGPSTDIRPLPQDVAAAGINKDLDEVQDGSYPDESPETLLAANAQVTCLGWQTVGSGNNVDAKTTVYVGKEMKLKVDDKGNPTEAVKISTPNDKGIRVDYFYMPPGRGAIIRQATSPAQFKTGSIILVSDRGVKYGIPDATVAQGLGLEVQKPAPKNIVSLLPDGAQLSPDNANQNFDTAPDPKGDRTPPSQGSG